MLCLNLPHTNLSLNVRSLVWRRSGQDARIGETGLEKSNGHEDKEDTSDGGYTAGQVFDQEGAAVMEGWLQTREKTN